MVSTKVPTIKIDLDQFKLHLNLPDQSPLSLHFDTPSRRFYLSVIALVADQLRKNSNTASVLQEPAGIEKIPLKTRLELITRLAMGSGHVSSRHSGASGSSGKGTAESEMSSSADPGGPEVLLQNILNAGSDEPFYTAPELQDGRSPSPRSEVYALGVLLYQVVVGDLSRPLEADWKEVVTDDILREDIAACVETLPEKRLATPLEFSRDRFQRRKRHGRQRAGVVLERRWGKSLLSGLLLGPLLSPYEEIFAWLDKYQGHSDCKKVLDKETRVQRF